MKDHLPFILQKELQNSTRDHQWLQQKRQLEFDRIEKIIDPQIKLTMQQIGKGFFPNLVRNVQVRIWFGFEKD